MTIREAYPSYPSWTYAVALSALFGAACNLTADRHGPTGNEPMAGSLAGQDATAGGDAGRPGTSGAGGDGVAGGHVEGGSGPGGSGGSGGTGGARAGTGGQASGSSGRGGSGGSGTNGGAHSGTGGQASGSSGRGGSGGSGANGGAHSGAGGQVSGSSGRGGSGGSGGTGGARSGIGDQLEGGAGQGGWAEDDAGGSSGQDGSGGSGGTTGGPGGDTGGTGGTTGGNARSGAGGGQLEGGAGQGGSGGDTGGTGGTTGGNGAGGIACEPCSVGTCQTVSASTCNSGIWPDGKIYWDWDRSHPEPSATVELLVREAMEDWETVTHNVVSFVPSTTHSPRVRVWAGAEVSDSWGYDQCSADPVNCHSWFHATVEDTTAKSDDIYHELGHVIGLSDHSQRADRDHYVSICPIAFDGCSSSAESCNSSTLAACDGNRSSVFGPFDFRSTMHRRAAYPAITRWDGSLFIPEDDSCSCPPDPTRLPLPEQCCNDDCTGSNCSTPPNGPGPMCPTCRGCLKRQPMGFPTQGDAAAVVDLYGAAPSYAATSSRWQPFVRTVQDDGREQPFDYSLAPGVQIQPNTNPALASREEGTLRLYVLGTDGRIYEKQKTATSQWRPWNALSDTQTFDSSPGAVARDAQGIDVVARGLDGNVYINTLFNDSWTDWQSLGTPSVGASSAPAITSFGPDEVYLFVRGGDNALWMKSCSADCSGDPNAWTDWWQPFGTETFWGVPAPLSDEFQTIHVFVHGWDHTIRGNWYFTDGTSGGYYYQVRPETVGFDASCEDCYSPAVFMRNVAANPFALDIVVRGTDDQLWQMSWVEGETEWLWTPYQRLGGVLKSAPATVTRNRPVNRVDVVAIMDEEHEAGTWESGVWWKAWPNY